MKVRVYQYPKPGYVLGIIGSALEKWIFKAYSWTRLFFIFFPHLKIFQETFISVFEICTSYFLLNFICFPFFVHCSLKDYTYILTSKLFWLIKVWSRCKYVLRLDKKGWVSSGIRRIRGISKSGELGSQRNNEVWNNQIGLLS